VQSGPGQRAKQSILHLKGLHLLMAPEWQSQWSRKHMQWLEAAAFAEKRWDKAAVCFVVAVISLCYELPTSYSYGIFLMVEHLTSVLTRGEPVYPLLRPLDVSELNSHLKVGGLSTPHKWAAETGQRRRM
jgi:hypothetical protein